MFDLDKDGLLVVSPDKLALPFFKDIWDADKSAQKSTAIKELSYVFYYCDFKSPYFSYPEDKKAQLIATDIMKDHKFKPSKLIKTAIEKYKELTETPEMRLLSSWEGKINEMADFVKRTPLNLETYQVLEKAGLSLEKIVTSVQKLREIVNKQLSNKATIRGGKEKALFED